VGRATEVHQFGTDYIELRGAGDIQVTFEAPPTVKIVNNEARSGQYQWWSNRGDDSDMTLTCPFDLRGLQSATLQFWAWYDIEKDWDYAYVEISTDGGRTWDIIQGAHSSDCNPNGNSFGWAYTGVSGGGQMPVWVQEQIDLTPYVGQETVIRFEYVTDDAVNHVGLCLDDISVPELGYFDDVESEADWEARGFIRSSNQLPQRFLLQLIEFGPEVRVRWLGDTAAAGPAPEAPSVEPGPATNTSQGMAGLECQPYEVQAHDSLWSLAEKFLGDGAASEILVAATNAQHELDASYAQIQDSRMIRTGWRLCVPAGRESLQAILALQSELGHSGSSPTRGDILPHISSVIGSYQFVLRGLGHEVERAVLAVSGVTPVTTEPAPYRYTITPLFEGADGDGS